MKVGLTIKNDKNYESYSSIFDKMSTKIKNCFCQKNYGDELEDLVIGLIVMGAGSEKFHPVIPFTYEKESSYKDIFTNKRVIIKNAASYSIKPDCELLTKMSLNEAEHYLSQVLIESTEILERNQDQFPSFDVKQFRKDFSNCLGISDSDY